jgi:hypothetical protein
VVEWQLGMFLGVSKPEGLGWFQPNNYLSSSKFKFNRHLLLVIIIIPRPRFLGVIPIPRYLVMEHKGLSHYQVEAEGGGLHGMVILLSSIVNMVSVTGLYRTNGQPHKDENLNDRSNINDLVFKFK